MHLSKVLYIQTYKINGSRNIFRADACTPAEFLASPGLHRAGCSSHVAPRRLQFAPGRTATYLLSCVSPATGDGEGLFCLWSAPRGAAHPLPRGSLLLFSGIVNSAMASWSPKPFSIAGVPYERDFKGIGESKSNRGKEYRA